VTSVRCKVGARSAIKWLAMRIDRESGNPVARLRYFPFMQRTRRALAAAITIAIAGGCGPRYDPRGPDTGPSETPPAPEPREAVGPPSRELMIGEMCPAAASGRPGVMPLVMRRLGWTDDRGEVAEALERNMARQFSVLGWDGRRVGVFSVIGAAEGPSGVFAAGSYAGGSACEVPAPGGKTRAVPDCEKTLLSCGLAIAVLRPSGGAGAAPFEEEPDPAAFTPAGACVAGDRLVFDVDDDGRREAFRVSDFLDAFRAPADEVSAVPAGKAKCDPSFASRGVLPASDPRDWRGLDVVGVLDLDGDGRRELIAVFNYQTRRTWAIYSARSSAGRLDLVGEGVAWPRDTGEPDSTPVPTEMP
jgi:hypothetical protein